MANDMMEAYLYEMNTLLESLDEMVLGAEDRKTFSQEDVNEIFRIMHTIKGSSAMMEFDNLMTVAHRIEDMFFIIRDKGMEAVAEELRPELFDLIFQAIDFFKAEVEKLESGASLTEDIDSILANIKSFSNKIQGKADEEEPAAEAKAEPEAPAASEAGGHTSSKFPFGIRVFFDEGAGMENLRAFMLASAVRDSVESESDFDYYPADVDTNSETSAIVVDEGFSIRFLTDELRQKALAVVKDAGSVGNYNLFEYEAPEAQETQAAPQQAEPPKAQAAAPQSTPAAPAPAAQQGGNNNANKNQKESLISVNLSKLDELNAVVGEIVITESMVTASPDLEGLKLDNFTSAARQLRSLTDQLQDVSMSLRMVSVSATFQKMRRIVRDMSKKLGKEVNLVLEGEETEIDKTIVDSISDPLMHIVRNSMDHGIEENVQDRIAAGKDPVGRIVLSARHTGSEVIIEVIDDGQGADDEAILNKAMRQGLAVPGVDYSHKDILNFLLMPGFSTNVEVTEYSGRGVGMDVVKSNVESVGGTVSISSEKGHGMTTTLKIPLTMAIMDGMEVSVGDSVFTVPINNIRSILKMTNGDVIHDSTKGETLRVMDNFYSVVRAKEFYQMEKGQDEIDDGIILWVESGDNSFCLFVDKLIGEQQVVVKPLPDYVNNYGIRNYGVTGCTILGNGDISIILDVASIYAASQAG
ncbi:MAG: chemotaxis protein CheA [Acutalibacter sp.]|jgi:two-component system chemotaxis sensor kinase CheA|uniref:chemotaxis protein CheA n=1 Tax=Acutalibacter sp. TaxID=1918636 RepID=UPI0021733D0F|nr:chemotaxis protein CheA [Acutalibacter sp.]MCI9224492.1 chemotaxis protein CheA [Acutalibacter sp.]